MSIGQRIKKRREELGMSQEELAKMLGYKSRSSINKIELDARNLTQPKIKAIADALLVTPGYIMGWSIEKPAASSPGPLRDYYDRLVQFLDSFPEYRQLVSDAVHVRPEDIDFASQCLERLADPESSAPDLPDSARSGLTAEALALVRDTPEVLAAEAEYIKSRSKQQSKPERSASTSTGGANRKSG